MGSGNWRLDRMEWLEPRVSLLYNITGRTFSLGSVSATYGTVIVLAISFAIAAIGALLYYTLLNMTSGSESQYPRSHPQYHGSDTQYPSQFCQIAFILGLVQELGERYWHISDSDEAVSETQRSGTRRTALRVTR